MPPLLFNPQTKEPYLPLPAPHNNIIITPSRYSDCPSVIPILNHPAVYNKLYGPPFPYTQESWDIYWPISSSGASKALEEYLAVEEFRSKENGGGGGEGLRGGGGGSCGGSGKTEEEVWRRGKWIGGGSPVTIIREVKGDGEEVYLGEIFIRRRVFEAVKDGVERERLKGLNDGLEAGDPAIQWEMGFYLSPAAHGRGIMPTALQTLRETLYIPYMNLHILSGSFYETNLASRKVFEKTGFEFDCLIPDALELNEKKTGVKGLMMGTGIMVWKR